jgi:hypothetical protein
MDLRGNISARLKQCSANADDILITTRTKRSIINTFQKLKEIAVQSGLIINKQKTEYLRCRRNNHAMDNINITSMHLKQVKLFKYLGSIINGNNSTEEEINERIVLGNKAYYAYQALFKSKLLSKNSKLQMYWALVRPMVTYACETWVLNESIKQKLLVFERKILRRISGPTKERDGMWRIKTNDELN